MSTLDAILTSVRSERRGRARWPGAAIALPSAVLLVVAAAAVFPQLFTSFDPEVADPRQVFVPPSPGHWFGTDQLGRDVFARVVHGAGYSLAIGLGATVIAFAVGASIGLLAGLGPRGLDRVVVRVIDVLLAFPDLLLALLVIAVLGRGPVNTLVAVGLGSAAGYARLIRSQVLQVRLSGYVEHARALGEGRWRIAFTHVLPNTVRPLVVIATIGVGSAVLSASALSFLGLGVAPPTPEWGAILSEARSYLNVAPWISIAPATIVAVTVISITVLGRRLQTVLAKGAGA